MMFDGYDINSYYDFIDECRLKDYSNVGIHRHHIIPKFTASTEKDVDNWFKKYDGIVVRK